MNECGFQFDNSYLNLPDELYTQLDPLPVSAPTMVILNHDLAASMGLKFSQLTPHDQASLFAGNTKPQDAQPFSQAYAGHQFGHFTVLGDGRAHIWGEHITPDGNRFDIQFKGSGRTPYSRRGDGRAALGPMLREYIVSEAMHTLGIPTTRALAVVKTGENVTRETMLPGSILTRLASSHIRVGTFEFAAMQGNRALIETLLGYTIKRHDPDLQKTGNSALAFLHRIMDRQADLIVHWMRVGFIHGVMNTDNMSISGETIDYGPCAFMDSYDPSTVFSSIDHMGRYAYANQPVIAQWNIARLAEALLPLIDNNIDIAIKKAEKTVHAFSNIYQDKWLAMMRAKLGLFGTQTEDPQLISDLLDWMQDNHADYTNTFLALSQEHKPSFKDRVFDSWYIRWQTRLKKNQKPFKSSLCLMQNNNPAIIPRNHNVEYVLKAAHRGNMSPFQDLLTVLKNPYKNHDGLKPYQAPPEPSEYVFQTFCGT